MKKLVLATAVAALSVTAAQAAPTVYGKAGVQLNYTDSTVEIKDGADKDSSEVTLDSDSTRFGLKGSEAITANTDLVYKTEFGLDITDPRSGDSEVDFKQRDTYVGLENSSLGSLMGGRITSIDDEVDYTNPTELGENISSYNEARWDNSLVYATPSMDGLQLMAQYAVDDFDKGAEDSYALAAKYDGAGFGAGISYVDLKDGSKDVDSALRVSGAVDVTSELTLSGLYQATDFEAKNAETENSFTIGGEYDIANTPWSLNAQYDMVQNKGGNENVEGYGFAGGAEYAFTKATTGKIYTGYTETTYDKVAAGDVESESALTAGVGILHKF